MTPGKDGPRSCCCVGGLEAALECELISSWYRLQCKTSLGKTMPPNDSHAKPLGIATGLRRCLRPYLEMCDLCSTFLLWRVIRSIEFHGPGHHSPCAQKNAERHRLAIWKHAGCCSACCCTAPLPFSSSSLVQAAGAHNTVTKHKRGGNKLNRLWYIVYGALYIYTRMNV